MYLERLWCSLVPSTGGRSGVFVEARFIGGVVRRARASLLLSERGSACGRGPARVPPRMRRGLFEDLHEDFRASFRTFLEREVIGEAGRYLEWERDGLI